MRRSARSTQPSRRPRRRSDTQRPLAVTKTWKHKNDGVDAEDVRTASRYPMQGGRVDPRELVATAYCFGSTGRECFAGKHAQDSTTHLQAKQQTHMPFSLLFTRRMATVTRGRNSTMNVLSRRAPPPAPPAVVPVSKRPFETHASDRIPQARRRSSRANRGARPGAHNHQELP